MVPLTRAGLPGAAEARVLYAALWDRRAADEARALLPGDAFAGRAAVLWALICHHDATHEPDFPPATATGDDMTLTNHHDATHRARGDHEAGVPARPAPAGHAAPPVETFAGPGRVLAILATALGLAVGHDDPLLSRVFHVAVREGGLVDAAVAPVGPWPLGMDAAREVLRHAAVAAHAAYAVAALDAIAADPTHEPGALVGVWS